MSDTAPDDGTAVGTQVSKATFCVITIERDATNKPTGLSVSPNRPGDSLVYYPKGGTPPRTDLPHHVVWLVDDLRAGEKLKLETKPQQYHPFSSQPLTITHPQHRVSSGPVMMLPWEANLQRPAFWHYNVTLEANGTVPIVLDPTIIIEEDP